MPNAILLEGDASQRMLLKALLEGGGYQVQEAGDPERAQDLIRASKPHVVLARGEEFSPLVNELRRLKPEVEVLETLNYGNALVEGALGRDAVATFARDTLRLLVNLVEGNLNKTPQVDALTRVVELSAHRLRWSRQETETAAVIATLAALGPHLTNFRYGAEAPKGALAGLSRVLHASLAVAALLRSPYPLTEGITALEERFDGRGRPAGLAGGEIPLASRLVAIALAYVEELETKEPSLAAEAIRERAGSHFDPYIMDAFFQALRDERYVERLSGGSGGVRILVARADAGAQAICELRLAAAGFDVDVCSDGAEAFDKITAEPHPAAVIADTTLSKLDGISLLLKLKRHPTAKAVPIVFVATKSDPALIKKALALGAKDVLAEPLNFELLSAKLQNLTAGAATSGDAIAGDLAEMPLSDFFQVLALGRKTARIEVLGPGVAGEVFFEQGLPIAAIMPDRQGVGAFCLMVLLKEGSFRLFPNQSPQERNLDQNLEGLLLHAAWLEDEADR
tara:strand:+ start:358 stop:1890 length:1533 start_codon:yes stop_codon:yes gene_type:complete